MMKNSKASIVRPHFDTSSVRFIGFAALVVLLATACASHSQTASRHAALGISRISFIGDSYTAGTVAGGLGDENYTQILARNYDFSVDGQPRGGTGYLESSARAAPFEQAQLPRAVAFAPQAVIVMGSRNDYRWPAQDLTRAAAHLYRSLQDALPGAKIIAIGPAWTLPTPPPVTLLGIASSLRTGAFSANVPFYDPLSDHWFAQTPPCYVAADNVHPTDAGHRYLAAMVAQNLTQAGVLIGPGL